MLDRNINLQLTAGSLSRGENIEVNGRDLSAKKDKRKLVRSRGKFELNRS